MVVPTCEQIELLQREIIDDMQKIVAEKDCHCTNCRLTATIMKSKPYEDFNGSKIAVYNSKGVIVYTLDTDAIITVTFLLGYRYAMLSKDVDELEKLLKKE